MNYQEIIDTSLQYADKVNDTELRAILPSFLPLVEANFNRALSTQRQAIRSRIQTVAGQEYYSLPADFAGLRDIETRPDETSTSRETLDYVTPEQMNYVNKIGTTSKNVYTIIANQLQVYPYSSAMVLEVVYYRNVPPLTGASPSNWISSYNPDLYVFGLLVEIMAYLKNADAAGMWQQRLDAAILAIESRDGTDRWSGTSLTMKVG